MQDDFETCYYFIADYHSLTTHNDAKELPINVRRSLATYLACGLNPDKAIVYLQSDLPQIPELYLLLNMFAHKGELEKCTTFKEKIRTPGQTVNAGLLTYPVLMAADIIIHKATKVPVGKDQQQHLEMTRTFANRFNHLAQTEYFPEPQGFSYGNTLLKILSLDGSGGKMSKSDGNENNAVYLLDDDKTITKKIKRAKTDGGPTEKNSVLTPGIEALFGIMDSVSKPEIVADYKQQYADCSIKYGYLKVQLAEDLVNFIAPIREKIIELESDTDFLADVVAKGGAKARESAQNTVDGVRKILGLQYF
ncbi:UNVERIFIED_CONTAM: hypothetical protein GTU68_004981 [Idotea baltica]|nr:hypothetical protein [Idotea baltica]